MMWSNEDGTSQSPRHLKGFLSTLHAVYVRNLALDTVNVNPTMYPAYQPFLPSVSFELTAILPLCHPSEDYGTPSDRILQSPAVKKALRTFSLRTMQLDMNGCLKEGRGLSGGNHVDEKEDSLHTPDTEEEDMMISKILDMDPSEIGTIGADNSETSPTTRHSFSRGLSIDSDVFDRLADNLAVHNETNSHSDEWYTPRHKQKEGDLGMGDSGIDLFADFADLKVLYASEDVAGTSNPNWVVTKSSFKNIWDDLERVTEFQITFFKNKETVILDFEVNVEELTPLGVGLAQLPAIPEGAVFFRLSSHHTSLQGHPGIYVTPWLRKALAQVTLSSPTSGIRPSFRGVSEQNSGDDLKKDSRRQSCISDSSNSQEQQEAQCKKEYQSMLDWLQPFSQKNLQVDKNQDRREHLRNLVKRQKELLEEEETRVFKELELLKKDAEELQQYSTQLDRRLDLKTKYENQVRKESEQLIEKNFLHHCQQIKLVSYLQYIYPIESSGDGNYSIRGIEIPSDPVNIYTRDDEHISTALGYLCHLMSMLSKYLKIPLPNKIMYNSSRSMIRDLIFSEQDFPLFKRGMEREKFDRGLQLLDRNIDELLLKRGITFDKTTPMLKKLKQLYSFTSSYVPSNLLLSLR